MASEIMLNGPEGRLEAIYHHCDDEDVQLALILHPHPQLGGDMHNKVVVTLFNECVKRRFSVLRFNFRGVGRSQGIFETGNSSGLLDTAYALDWLQLMNPFSEKCWLMGFSYGSYLALEILMRRPEIFGFVAVAPPCQIYDFSFFSPCPSSGLFVVGDKDIISGKEKVRKLAYGIKLQNERKVRVDTVEGADHFFKGKIPELGQCIGRYLDSRKEDPVFKATSRRHNAT